MFLLGVFICPSEEVLTSVASGPVCRHENGEKSFFLKKKKNGDKGKLRATFPNQNRGIHCYEDYLFELNIPQRQRCGSC